MDDALPWVAALVVATVLGVIAVVMILREWTSSDPLCIIFVAERRPAQPPNTFRSGPRRCEPREHRVRGSHRSRGRVYASRDNPGTMRQGAPSARRGH